MLLKTKMSGSYGTLQRQLNTLLQLQLDNQGGTSATPKLQQVLEAGNSSTIGLAVKGFHNQLDLTSSEIKLTNGSDVTYTLISQGGLMLTNNDVNTVTMNEFGLSCASNNGTAIINPNNFSFDGSVKGLYSNPDDSNIQLLNEIGNVDISGATVSIMGVNYKPTFSGTNAIISYLSTGRIVFSTTPLAYIPSVSISQVSTGDVVGLCITDITNFDFGFKSTNISIGSISWTAK